MTRVAIVQARMGSVRFPGKVMQTIGGVPLIGLLLQRLAGAQRVDRIVVATSDAPVDAPLATYVRSLGYDVFQGSETDVLDRYYQAAISANADIVVRITGDCPLVDPALVDAVIDALEGQGTDYASNIEPPTFPDGLDVEAVRMDALARAWREATAADDREHVTLLIRRGTDFTRTNIALDNDLSGERWTVDAPEDLRVIERVFSHFEPRRDFTWQEVDALRRHHPDYFEDNRHFERNAGAAMNTGQKLWQRAKAVIPGGNMLLSKRAEMFLPGQWPAYYSKASGCRVWDLDGREYIDMSLMGIGTNTLGYGHPDVDAAVRAAIDAGNMSTLNCPEEVQLAERLVAMHPWADMARFARSGGEANAIAVRIARAASGRDKVAVCGYHGWHDWYLAANLGDLDNLSELLLPGLEPNGVPRELRGSVLPFRYNRFDELEALVTAHPDVGVIKMEVARSGRPDPGFLESVRALASARGIVLIFDECTSGFRETFGGLHLKYGVDPDVAVFGKTLGNGYAITAILGRREIMEAAQTTFISSTFWTERIGPVAALASLAVMERTTSWQKITATGSRIMDGWRQLAAHHGLAITVAGLPALATFRFDAPRANAYRTLVTQEMLAKGYLAGSGVYACIEHSDETVATYFANLDPVFALIRECEDGRDIDGLLQGPEAHTGFSRLN
jgi:glutamate-1-semialdehyde 2,1-aminomutase